MVTFVALNLFGVSAFSVRASVRCLKPKKVPLTPARGFLFFCRRFGAGRALSHLLVGEAGADGDGESAGLLALSCGAAGPPSGSIELSVFRLPAALPVVMPFGIPVFGPVVAAPPEYDIPEFDVPPAPVAAPVCATATALESVNTEASARVAIFMVVSCGRDKTNRKRRASFLATDPCPATKLLSRATKPDCRADEVVLKPSAAFNGRGSTAGFGHVGTHHQSGL
jgi:hypothetical protein